MTHQPEALAFEQARDLELQSMAQNRPLLLHDTTDDYKISPENATPGQWTPPYDAHEPRAPSHDPVQPFLYQESPDRPGFWDRHFTGWRFGVWRSLVMTLVALLFNVAVLVALTRRFPVRLGAAIIYTGDCDTVHMADLLVHLALNISATLVTGACSFCMAGVCSPTRREVDLAHARGRWLDIGAQSWRNLRAIRTRNVVCWALLCFASVPFHWVFNAAFYATRQSYQHSVSLVSRDFFLARSGGWRPSINNSSPALFAQDDYFVPLEDDDPPFDKYFRIGSSGRTNDDDGATLSFLRNVFEPSGTPAAGQVAYTRLDPRECIAAYGKGFVEDRSNLLVITGTANATDPVLWSRWPMVHIVDNQNNADPFAWMCHDLQTEVKHDDDDDNGDDDDDDDGDWNKNIDYCEPGPILRLMDRGGTWTVRGHAVSHCISQAAPRLCRFSINVYIMLMSIFFVAVGTGAMAYMAWMLTCQKKNNNNNNNNNNNRGRSGDANDNDSEDEDDGEDASLRTIGDAVVSFLAREDETTRGMCLVSKDRLAGGKNWNFPPVQYHDGKKTVRLATASSRREWWTVFSITLLFGASLSGCLYVTQNNGARSYIRQGLGFTSHAGALTAVTRDSSGTSSVVPTILVADIPQLVFSVVVLLYEGLMVRLLAAVEWRSLATTREALRVSRRRPRGAQLSTRMLDLPTTLALVLMAFTAGGQWLLSQSLFLVRIDGVDGDGVPDPQDVIARLGYSSMGILLVVAAVVVPALAFAVWLGWGRRISDSMPGDGINSVIISAACHLPEGERGREAALCKLAWGDVDVDGSSDGQAVGHCSLSSGPVRPPVEGMLYA